MEGIPIRNLYLLLCYAMEQAPEAPEAWQGTEAGGYLALLAKLLVDRTQHTLHHGLDRGHIAQRDLLGTVRGRVDLAATITGLQHRKAKLWCEFEDHLPEVLHNRILRTTLERLAGDPRIPPSIRRSMPALLRRFSAVPAIKLRAGLFRQVNLGRQNSHYRLLMGLCELIFMASLPNDQKGITRFYHYLRETFGMAKIFEDFIRNFLRAHGREQGLRVLDRRGIPWTFDSDPDWEPLRREELIPAMEADVLVETPKCLLVLDAKYYEHSTRSKYGGSPKLYSSNIYQIQAYVEALAQRETVTQNKPIEGMLIYPTTDQTQPVSYKVRGHRYHVRTLDLTGRWEAIHQALLSLTIEPIEIKSSESSPMHM